MSEILQFADMLAANQQTGIKTAESVNLSEQDRQILEDVLHSIDAKHPAVPLLKALISGDNYDIGVLSAILSDANSMAPELAQFLLKYFQDSLLLSLKSGTDFDSALERAINMTHTVADTWTASADNDDNGSTLADATNNYEVYKAVPGSSIDTLPESMNFQDALDKALQGLYTDVIKIGEPGTDSTLSSIEAIGESPSELADTALEILHKLVPDLDVETRYDMALEGSSPESLFMPYDGTSGLESLGPGNTYMAFQTGPTNAISPTLATYTSTQVIQPVSYNTGTNSYDINPFGNTPVTNQTPQILYSNSSTTNHAPNIYLSPGDLDKAEVVNSKPVSSTLSIFAYLNLNGEDDKAPSNDNETKNLTSILQNTISNGSSYTLSTEIKNFDYMNFSAELNKASIFFMPDLAGKSVGNDISFPETSKDLLKTWVSDGGTLVLTSTGESRGVDFLNFTFGWDLVSIESKDDPSHTWELNSANAAGTPFEGSPSSLPFINMTTSIGAGSVAGFNPIYGSTSDAAVAVISYGSGQVVFLGPDFTNSGISGTGIAGPGKHYTTDVLTGTNSTSAWVTDIIPKVLDYSHIQSTSGTLTMADQDLSDTVSVSIKSVAVDYAGDINKFGLSTNDLLSLMKVTGEINSSSTTGTINWSFSTGKAANFSNLGTNETIKLTYSINALDNKGAGDDHYITITLKGSGASTLIVDNAESLNSLTATSDSSMLIDQTESKIDLASHDSIKADSNDNGQLITENLLKAITANSDVITDNNVFVERYTTNTTADTSTDYLKMISSDNSLHTADSSYINHNIGLANQDSVLVTQTGELHITDYQFDMMNHDQILNQDIHVDAVNLGLVHHA